MSLWTRLVRITEQIIPSWGTLTWSGLRSKFQVKGIRFFAEEPRYDHTIVNYDLARQLYRNDGADYSLGSAFAKPIIDLQVDFIGHPTASTEDVNVDDFLNDCLQNYWADVIQQMFRNALRDSKTVVRLQQDPLDNPLITEEERLHCRLEIVDPERVDLEYDLSNSRVIKQAVVRHKVMVVEDEGDPSEGILPKMREHEIWEIIDREEYRYYDRLLREELVELRQPNTWGFVPFVEVWNEYDSTLSGGQSDLESCYPFIRAFHDVLSQGLQAHKYHSIPKVKFKLNEVATFVKNNFPDALDENGQLKSQATISWKGKEIIFLSTEEDADFLEARSVLGDTKTLADFILDCICIASETPRWAFMIVDAGASNQSNNAQTLPWVKKIGKKRINFTPYIQRLLKMVMVVNAFNPVNPALSWQIIRVEDQAAFNQALQQLVMGLEVAASRGIISDTTYRELLRQFIPVMKNPAQEAKDALKNVQPALPAPPAPTDQPSPNGQGQAQNVPVTQGQTH